VPIGTFAGLTLAAIVYMAASAAIMGILPRATLAKSNAPFADAVVPMLGAAVASVIALFALMKAFGNAGHCHSDECGNGGKRSLIGRLCERAGRTGSRLQRSSQWAR